MPPSKKISSALQTHYFSACSKFKSSKSIHSSTRMLSEESQCKPERRREQQTALDKLLATMYVRTFPFTHSSFLSVSLINHRLASFDLLSTLSLFPLASPKTAPDIFSSLHCLTSFPQWALIPHQCIAEGN